MISEINLGKYFRQSAGFAGTVGDKTIEMNQVATKMPIIKLNNFR